MSRRLACFVLAMVAGAVHAAVQCNPPETLAAAVAGVFGPGVSPGDVGVADLAGRTSADLERLFLAAPAPDLALLLGKSVQHVSLVPGPGHGSFDGRKAFRPAALTDGECCAGQWSRPPTATPFKAYRVPSFFDGCPVLRLSYAAASNAPPVSRRKDEVRLVNTALALGVGLTEDDVGGDGVPNGSPAMLGRFFALDLAQSTPWQDLPAVGWPWAGSPPVGGPAPPGWTRAFPVDGGQYPFADRIIALRGGDLHYVDEGPSEPVGTVLLVHGNPTWSFLFRDVVPALVSQGYRVVVPDHYGFGLSDRPPAATFGFTPHELSDVLEDFVAALDLSDLLLVVHDWGTPIGLAMAGHMPSRVERIVITNGWAWNLDPINPGVYQKLAGWSVLNQVAADTFLMSGDFPRLVGESLAQLAEPAEATAVRDGYWGPYIDPVTELPYSVEAIAPTNILCQEILLDRDFLEATDLDLSQLASKPVAFLFGAADSFFGALRCGDPPFPTCPPGLTCVTIDGRDYCLDAQGEFVYPPIDRFLSEWGPDQVAGVEIVPAGIHFIMETEPERLAELVRYLDVFVAPGCSTRAVWPRLSADVPVVGGTLTHTLKDALPGAFALMYASPPTPGALPFASCLIQVNVGALALVGSGITDGEGSWSNAGQVPANPMLVGSSFRFQVVLTAPGGPILGAFELSNGVLATIR